MTPHRVALFGGTFDPPHSSHVDLIKHVQKIYRFDQIFIIPSKFPPQKTPQAPYSKRLEWAQKVFKDRAFQVSDFESTASTTQFGIDLFYHFAEKFPRAEFSWILGEDQLKQLSYWKEIDQYGYRIRWVVIPRDSIDRGSGVLSKRLLRSSAAYEYLKLKKLLKASSSALRDHFSSTRRRSSKFLTFIPKEIKDDVLETYLQSTLTMKRSNHFDG